MTRKDYIKIARAIKDCRISMDYFYNREPQVDEIIRYIAGELKSDNSSFDIERFKEACQP